jgi:Arc/MetJ family transcription regulator
MRTNIDIDDTLLTAAMSALGQTTKKAAVDEALRLVVEQNRRRTAMAFASTLGWDGDLDEIRTGKSKAGKSKE